MSTEVFLFDGEAPQDRLHRCLANLPAYVDRLVVVEVVPVGEGVRYEAYRDHYKPFWPRMRYLTLHLPGGMEKGERDDRVRTVIRQLLGVDFQSLDESVSAL